MALRLSPPPVEQLRMGCDELSIKCFCVEWSSLGYKNENKYHLQFWIQWEVTAMEWVGSVVGGGKEEDSLVWREEDAKKDFVCEGTYIKVDDFEYCL